MLLIPKSRSLFKLDENQERYLVKKKTENQRILINDSGILLRIVLILKGT